MAPRVLPPTSRPEGEASSQAPNASIPGEEAEQGPGEDPEPPAPIVVPSSQAGSSVVGPANEEMLVEMGASVPTPASPPRGRLRKRPALPSSGAGGRVTSVSPSVSSVPSGETEAVDGAEFPSETPPPAKVVFCVPSSVSSTPSSSVCSGHPPTLVPERHCRFAQDVVIGSNDGGRVDFSRHTGAVLEDRTTFESSRLQVVPSGAYSGDISDEEDDTHTVLPSSWQTWCSPPFGRSAQLVPEWVIFKRPRL